MFAHVASSSSCTDLLNLHLNDAETCQHRIENNSNNWRERHWTWPSWTTLEILRQNPWMKFRKFLFVFRLFLNLLNALSSHLISPDVSFKLFSIPLWYFHCWWNYKRSNVPTNSRSNLEVEIFTQQLNAFQFATRVSLLHVSIAHPITQMMREIQKSSFFHAIQVNNCRESLDDLFKIFISLFIVIEMFFFVSGISVKFFCYSNLRTLSFYCSHKCIILFEKIFENYLQMKMFWENNLMKES
jgi:hypothetical protein